MAELPGDIRVQVNAVRKSGRFAWVEFATLQASQQALTLDGESLGAGIMKVSQSKTPIHTAGWRAPVCARLFDQERMQAGRLSGVLSQARNAHSAHWGTGRSCCADFTLLCLHVLASSQQLHSSLQLKLQGVCIGEGLRSR